ncbi:phosphodiester glycosidase family protein [Mucilaginibacter sp. RS28]|uniref:Phosphodiester glycosidase family protein n=1 Tax=Mucilaginibacter straminoryzae TaxID=2932774 RepID=A0A9X1X2P7_9SPHI|nr:phosphodiester glycosidase family protein [Mucilaginibacter straminoryzae]MCJ8209240.1 phosphodiester glycosidase family protein [Mucilaginibacter straminoryzae]
MNFKRVEWESKRLAPGIKLKQAWFRGNSLFKSSQFISVLEVKQGGRNKFDLAFEPKVKRITSDFGQKEGAIAAINGTFFDVKNGGSVDYLRVHGQVINANRLEKNNTRARHQRAAIVVKDGLVHIDNWDGGPDWETKLLGDDVMLTGPLLLYQDKGVEMDTSLFARARHPRSAVAINDKHRVLLITVDGRDANAAGMSLFELKKILQWMHCTDAVNLDGGGSTTLWDKEDGVVNHPSDNNKWDHEGQRKVANVVILKRN